jgi:hypothetical protein
VNVQGQKHGVNILELSLQLNIRSRRKSDACDFNTFSVRLKVILFLRQYHFQMPVPEHNSQL